MPSKSTTSGRRSIAPRRSGPIPSQNQKSAQWRKGFAGLGPSKAPAWNENIWDSTQQDGISHSDFQNVLLGQHLISKSVQVTVSKLTCVVSFKNLILGLITGGGVWKTKPKQAASGNLASAPFTIAQAPPARQTETCLSASDRHARFSELPLLFCNTNNNNKKRGLKRKQRKKGWL